MSSGTELRLVVRPGEDRNHGAGLPNFATVGRPGAVGYIGSATSTAPAAATTSDNATKITNCYCRISPE
jgi:hypothetical protein